MSDRGEKNRTAAFVGLRENLRMAMQNLRGNKGRSGLVILGVALGVTTLMAMVSIIEGFKGKLESEIMNTDTTQIYLTQYDPFDEPEENSRNKELTIADGQAVETLQDIKVDPRELVSLEFVQRREIGHASMWVDVDLDRPAGGRRHERAPVFPGNDDPAARTPFEVEHVVEEVGTFPLLVAPRIGEHP